MLRCILFQKGDSLQRLFNIKSWAVNTWRNKDKVTQKMGIYDC